MTKQSTPALRFDGFDGEWGASTLQDLTDKFTDGDWIESKDQSSSGIRLLQTGNVGISRFLAKAGSEKWVSESTFHRLRCEEILPGDILISRLPEPAGRACKVPALPYKMITAVDCTIVRTDSSNEPNFLLAYLSTAEYFDSIRLMLAGGTRQRVSRSNLATISIPTPPVIEEQRAIGELFADLDALIEQHRAKHANLQQTKTALMQHMFPQDGADEPELRLDGFSGAWVTKTVDQICPLQRGFDLPASKLVEGSVPVVTSNGVARHHNVALVKGPGVTTGRSGTIGKVHFVEQDYWPHNTALWVTNFKGNDPRFIYHLLERIDPSNFSSGSGVPTLNRNDLHDFVSSIPPTLEEQRAVGEVFSNLDALIAAESRYITQLTQAKTALLQRMSV